MGNNKTEGIHADGSITTYSGIQYSLLNPRVEDILIEDIAHHLSNICRYTGACREFYSVAQHSWHVSFLCDPEYALEGLMHDSSEAYVSDMSAPLKHSPNMLPYRDIEEINARAIVTRFGLRYPWHASIKEADFRMYKTECRDLMPAGTGSWYGDLLPYDQIIRPFNSETAKSLFLCRFHTLTNALKIAVDNRPALR